LLEPKKILLLRLSALGDVVLTTPLIRVLRRNFPNATIDFVVKAGFAELVEHNPHLDTVHRVAPQAGLQGLLRLGRSLRDERYDVVLDLHRNFRSRFLLRACAAPRAGYYRKHVLRRWLFVKFRAATMQHVPPVYARYLHAASFLEVKDDGAGTELFWNEAHEHEAWQVLRENGWEQNLPLLCLAPGAGYFTKRWPVEYFAEVAQSITARTDLQIAVLGGTQDRELGAFIRAQAGARILDLTGRCSLLASAVVIKRSRLLLANDSGLMHVAEAVRTPVVALFGSTTRELGFFPYRAASHVLEHTNLSCRPCSHLGHRACPRGHFRCMKEITPPQALAAITAALAENRSS
jgi:heptosyltransferase-2